VVTPLQPARAAVAESARVAAGSAVTGSKPASGPESVTFQEATKRYPDGTVAVEHLDLECPAGQISVLVGPSGCGKTTSLRMVNRMVTPTSGRILLNESDVAAMDAASLRRQMGYVIQNAGLFPHRTIEDNISTVPVLMGATRREARAAAAGLMERVGLDLALARRYPYQLSGGQQQRVGVARALAADPPVLLMDEPFSAVDPLVRAELQRELLRLQGDLGKTIVFVTHDIDEAIVLGDQIAVFQHGGHLAQVASPETLLSAPVSTFVDDFLGGDKGVKWLSFIDTATIPLHSGPLQRPDDPAGPAGGTAWQLLVDGSSRALGWLPPGTSDRSAVQACRRTFHPGTDPMRSALDSALLSPAGLAVAVGPDDRVLGLASHADIATVIRAARGRHVN